VTILGLDLGTKKTGVALSSGVMAEGYATLDSGGESFNDFVAALKQIASEQAVDKVIIGLPLGKDSKPTAQSRWTKAKAQEIGAALHLPVEFVEESYSSAQAEGEKGDRDQNSARIILEQYINETSSRSL